MQTLVVSPVAAALALAGLLLRGRAR